MGTRDWISNMLHRKGKGVATVYFDLMMLTNYRFGWTNASIIYGFSLLSLHAKRALGVCAPYETYAKAAKRH